MGLRVLLETLVIDERLAPGEWRLELKDALEKQLPIRGYVRGPSGVVHEIIGDYCVCGIQWAAYSRQQGRALPVVDWVVVEAAVTCLECVVDL